MLGHLLRVLVGPSPDLERVGASLRNLLPGGLVRLEDGRDLPGFAELRGFYRAFRRWTGQTPAVWRAAVSVSARA